MLSSLVPQIIVTLRSAFATASAHRNILVCCGFDFIRDGRAVNTPPEFKLVTIPQPTDTYPEEVEVRSAEETSGIAPEDIIEGEEKYVVEQGTHYRISRPNKPDVILEIPYYAPLKPRLFPEEISERLIPRCPLYL
ncbi:hypothetical protein BOTBODRAFT_173839 [Botryobasidium botryosum FD-172 SS1]|uniref:Uncharacterized protein n=1 Tax=Botryobasidium botryosum (strain FD-172 SS1) TaxID=930990 RepID=A0A067MKX3_BOTB1|nr:hypothetical protein BOTBODRAFT_173839 [Botryobasidium botryosum FD-172 SS1]